jgi:hypothetical protein
MNVLNILTFRAALLSNSKSVCERISTGTKLIIQSASIAAIMCQYAYQIVPIQLTVELLSSLSQYLMRRSGGLYTSSK